MIRGLIVICIAALACAPAGAQQAVVQLDARPFSENLLPRANASGRFLVGVLATPEDRLPSGKGLFQGVVSLPLVTPGDGTRICLSVTSQDGTYTAENPYRVNESAAARRAMIEWPSNSATAAYLRDLPRQQIGALATIGTCRARGAVIPVIIGEGAGDWLHVMVNTQGGDLWAVLRDQDQRGRALRRARCAPQPEGTRTAFDARCPLGRWPTEGRLSVEIEGRTRNGLGFELLESFELRTARP